MKLIVDHELLWAFGGILGLLLVASLVAAGLGKRSMSPSARATLDNARQRINAWWLMSGVFGAALLTGTMGSIMLFFCLSLLALREFISLTPTLRADHGTLFWSFFVITPLQYLLVGVGWYGLFSIFIPVYGFLFIPIRSALVGETERFLERIAKIQWGLLIAVYCVSHAPALLMLEIRDFRGENAKLLLFLIVVVQLSDVFQYLWGKTLGRHKIAPEVSPNKTWEGFVGGVATASLLGTGLFWLTPFAPWQAAILALICCLLGFAGGLTMSAIKRDRGVKDFGDVIEGHGGILDRIDSLCFSAPVLFHLTRYFFSQSS
jgi:phosphatidate cytidylyltransferase